MVLGFAFKDIFQNLLSGILLLINKPFHIGDQIIVNNYEGTVENVRMRDTAICTYDNRRIVIPNSEIYKWAVTVNTAYESRVFNIVVGIGYEDDIDMAKQVIQNALKKCKTICTKEPPLIVAIELADASVNIQILWRVEDGTQVNKLKSTDEVIRHVKADLMTAGIDIPYPTQRLLLENLENAG